MRTFGSRDALAVHTEPPDVPFPSTTSVSRAITFPRVLHNPHLSREEVVTVRGPINRAQPPFIRFSLTGFLSFFTEVSLTFRVYSGLGTLGAAHGHLDPPLRSPTSLALHRAVPGALVPTRFSTDCRGCQPSGPSLVATYPGLATPTTASPTLFLVQRG
ncbi:hypothetical protein CDL15_Pgr008696 [Punica granatum]|uniref:Uncharacterized protein n=1 Tax=Punica granatum TaxID=22663 RepID=A0A218WC06_PUNGR|nr:hypothetical protein CDL15_Pgr008696 [Punica granatum]